MSQFLVVFRFGPSDDGKLRDEAHDEPTKPSPFLRTEQMRGDSARVAMAQSAGPDRGCPAPLRRRTRMGGSHGVSTPSAQFGNSASKGGNHQPELSPLAVFSCDLFASVTRGKRAVTEHTIQFFLEATPPNSENLSTFWVWESSKVPDHSAERAIPPENGLCGALHAEGRPARGLIQDQSEKRSCAGLSPECYRLRAFFSLSS
jgi:hypothetical protein